VAEHLALETIDRYRAGTLPPDRLLAVDDHLAACHDCRARANERLDPAASAATLFRTLGRDTRGEHCSYETLEAVVDGRLPADENQQVLVHIGECATCAEDLGDLRHARALLNTELSTRPAGFWSALGALWRQRWMTMTGGAVVAALGVWLVLVVGTRDIRPRQQAAGEAPVQGPGSAAAPTGPDSRASTVVVALRDGKGEIALHAGGELSGVTSLSEATRQAVAAALSTGRLAVVATTTLAPLDGSSGRTRLPRGGVRYLVY
jgi:anti-sigma factor RsiW